MLPQLSPALLFVLYFLQSSFALPQVSVTLPTVTLSTQTATNLPYPTPTSLNQKIVNYGKKFWGVAADPNTLRITINAEIIKKQFGSVTPENSMKWDATEPQRNQFTFGNSDNLVNWATSNGKLIRGYPLVWHSQLPTWVSNISDKATLTSVIQNHISQLAGRYRGKIVDWDVVYEVLNEDGSLKNTVFSRVFEGSGFINVAFTAARQADPNAKLYISDYNLDSANAKVNGLVNLVKSINAAGPPNARVIDGCATQTHLFTANNAGGVQAALTALATSGCDVAITELDITGASADDYTTVVRACINTSACVSITSFGVSDIQSWRVTATPLLWDKNYRPKPAYTAIMDL